MLDKQKPLSKRTYLKFFLRADNFHRLYKREYYDLLSYMGDLGGLIDVVFIFFGFLSSLLATRMFQAALV